MNLYEVAEEIGGRLSRIFLKDDQGKRPVHGTTRKFQEDPHWRDYPLFYEYFHGDTGAGSARATRQDGPGRSHVSCIYLALWRGKRCWSRKRAK